MPAPARIDRRVVIVHNHYRERGGEDVVFESESAMLRNRGWEVIPFVAHNDDIPAASRLTLATRAVWNEDVRRRLSALLRRSQPNVMHVHNTVPLLSPAVYYAAAASNTPVVQTLHNYRLMCVNGLLYRDGEPCTECVGRPTQIAGVAHGCYRGSRAASAVMALTTSLHRAARTWSTRVDRYIATTNFASQAFVAAGLPANRVVVKPNFMQEVEVPAHPAARTGSGPVVFIGRLSNEKGIDVLLAAITQLADATEFVIIGDGPMREAVRNVVASRPNLRWLGQLDRRALGDELARAACLVVPSACYETFGRTVVEAFAHGIPVVASDHGALRSLVDHQSTGLLFTPSSPNALASAIELMTCDRALNVRLGVSARKRFDECFTESTNFALLTEIYDAAAVERGRAAA